MKLKSKNKKHGVSPEASSPSKKGSKTFIHSLPDEILANIFSLLSIEDLAVNVQNVCCRWAVVSQDSSLWKERTYEASKETGVNLFYQVVSQAPKLKYLKIHNLHHFGWVEMEELLKHYGSMIKSINLSWKDVNKLHLVVKFCKNLDALRICGKTWGMGVIPYCLNALKDAESLTSLETPYVFRYPYHDFTDLFQSAKFCKLVTVDLSYGSFVNCGMLDALFRKCRNIKLLNLKYCVSVSDTALEFIYLLENLEHLDLKGCNSLTDIGTRNVVKCTTITFLNMDFCHNLTERSIEMCHHYLKNLKELHMNCRPIMDDDISLFNPQLYNL